MHAYQLVSDLRQAHDRSSTREQRDVSVPNYTNPSFMWFHDNALRKPCLSNIF